MHRRQPQSVYPVAAILCAAGLVLSGAALGQAPPGPPLVRKQIEVPFHGGSGALAITVAAAEGKSIAGITADRFEVVPLFELPQADAAQRGPGAEARGDGLVRFQAGPPRRAAVYVSVDTSDLEPPPGAVGYRVTARPGVAGDERRLALRKPSTWVVWDRTYYGGDRIGVEAIERCHEATMQSFYSWWEIIFYGVTHCPHLYPHGAELLQPGSATQILVGFDNAYPVRFNTWQDGWLQEWDYPAYSLVGGPAP